MLRRGFALAVACAALWAHTANAALMSIDLGSEYIKVCLVKPGRTPISIAVNEMSKRKSPALVGVVNGERLLGEEAFSFAVRYPETIFQRARDFLGKDPNDPTIEALLSEHGLPYKVVPHPTRGVASFQVGEDAIYSPEELVGSMLYYARQVAEAQAGSAVPDAVIAVPAFFGQRQRQAMADAAGLAGLNLMGLINTHTAAALQYGIERDFANRSQTIILYDMGSGTTEVSLVKFSTYTVKEAGKPRVYNQLEVRDVDWDHSLGANLLDMALARHFAAEFREKSKLDVDVTAHPKAMAKLRRQVRRTKEMLSANSAAPCTVEELYDGRDFQSSITREQFESLAADFFSRATAPLKRILERNALQPGDIDAVELLGGGSRVPRLQAALSEAMGGRQLDRHLDADEAIALGAGLFAANLSTSFRLRKFGMVDTTMYGVSLSLDHVVLGAAAAEEEPLQRVRNLLPYMKKLPNKRVVKLEHLAGDPLRFSLAYNASTPHGLPPGVTEPALAEFEATGIESVVQRYNTSGQVSLRFEADFSGLLRLDKVEAVVEYEVMEEKIIEVPVNETEGGAAAEDASAGKAEAAAAGDKEAEAGAKKAGKGAQQGDSDPEDDTDDNGNSDNNGGSGSGEGNGAAAGEEGAGAEEAGEKAADGEGSGEGEEEAKEAEGGKEAKGEGKAEGEGEAKKDGDASSASSPETNTTANATTTTTKPATVVKTVLVPKTKVAKVALTLGGRGWLSPPLSGSDLTDARRVLSRFEAAEAVKRDVAKSRNDLESYIIAMKEALETDELVQKVSTEAQRESFRTRLTDEEDWLYMEADEGEGAQQFKDRLKQLREIGEPIKRRAEELELRPRVVDTLRSRLELARSVVKAWPDTKPWISETEREDVTKQLSALETDLDSKVAAQSSRADHEDPAFTVDELAAAYERFEKAYNKVNNKKKPKPPPEPKPAQGAGGADGEAGKDKEDSDAGAAGGEGAEGASGGANGGSEGGEGAGEQKEKGGAAGGGDAKEGSKAEGSKKADPKKDGSKAEGSSKGQKDSTKKDSKKKDEGKGSTKDSKGSKDSSKAKKDDAKKSSKDSSSSSSSKAKKDDAKKDTSSSSKTKKDDAKAGSGSDKKDQKDQKKDWSWNKKGKAEL